jgi:hypothetical protein
MTSRFVLSSQKVQSIDTHLQKRPEEVKLEPNVDVLTEAQQLYKKANKIYERLIRGAISVFDAKSFKVEDLLIRDSTEMALVCNYRLNAYNDQISVAKRLYRKLVK